MKKKEIYIDMEMEMLKILDKDERQVLLQGVPREVLFRIFGQPSMTFEFQGKELHHYGLPGLSFVEVEKGVVTRCESLPEQRAAFRVQPAMQTNVKVVTRFDKLNGKIIDLSVSGVALYLKQNFDFKDLDQVFLDFSLPLRGKEKTTLSIPATFYRMTEEDGAYKAIFLLRVTRGTGLYAKLAGYVVKRQTEMLIEYREKFMEGSGA